MGNDSILYEVMGKLYMQTLQLQAQITQLTAQNSELQKALIATQSPDPDQEKPPGPVVMPKEQSGEALAAAISQAALTNQNAV